MSCFSFEDPSQISELLGNRPTMLIRNTLPMCETSKSFGGSEIVHASFLLFVCMGSDPEDSGINLGVGITLPPDSFRGCLL